MKIERPHAKMFISICVDILIWVLVHPYLSRDGDNHSSKSHWCN